MYLLCGKIAPAYEGTEMGIGDSSLMSAIATGLGCSTKQLDQKGENTDGDIATTAQKLKATQQTLSFGAKPKPLTIKGKRTSLSDVHAEESTFSCLMMRLTMDHALLFPILIRYLGRLS